MLTYSRNGFVLLVLGLLVTCNSGCGKPENRLVKQQIALNNEIAAEMDKVTDKASAEPIGKAVEAIQKKYEADSAAWSALPAETQVAAKAAHQAEYDQSLEKLKEARKKYAAVMRGQ